MVTVDVQTLQRSARKVLHRKPVGIELLCISEGFKMRLDFQGYYGGGTVGQVVLQSILIHGV
jgi:hypothetical protein